MLHAKYYHETYSPKALDELCEIGDITPPDLERFQKQLEEIAAIYRWENSKWENPLPNNKITRELNTISLQAARLAASLEKISGPAEQAIERRTRAEAQRAISRRGAATDAPSLFLPSIDPNSDTLGLTLDITDLSGILAGLRNAATDGASDLPAQSPGQLRNWGLRIWIINIQNLWDEYSDQRFSLDISDQREPITHASRFCVAAFQIIDPDYPKSRVMHEMKLVMSEK